MISILDLRKRGLKAIEEEIKENKKAIISHRGVAKYVMIPIEEFIDIELELAHKKVLEDYKKGKYEVLASDEDIDKHIESL
jgi:hypothetical protein